MSEGVPARLDELDAVVWEADPTDLGCTFVNARAVSLLGHDALAWRRPGFLLDLAHPVDRPRLAAALARTAAGPARVRCRLRTASGDWRCFVAAIERVAHSAPSLRGVMIDVTDLHDEEEALTRAQAELVQADQLARFVSVARDVAHDFSNVLGAIAVLARLLERRSDDPAEVLLRAASIRGATDRGAELLGKLRALGPAHAAASQAVDVGQAVARMFPLLSRLAGEDLLLQLDVDPNVPRTTIAPAELERLLLHLVTHARLDAPAGGVYTLGVRAVHGTGDGLPVGEWLALGLAEPGQDSATPNPAFERILSTFEEDPGSNPPPPGLAPLQGLVARVRGHLGVTPTPGGGSLVRIYLPATPSSEGDTHAR